MALFTERSYDDIAADWERMRQAELQRQQQAAAEALAQAQNNAKAQEQPTGLGAVLSGIGNTFNNMGKSLGWLRRSRQRQEF